jgi:hypothetical protein
MRNARPGPTSRILGCADSAVGSISISRAITARRMDGTSLVARSGVEVVQDGLAMRWPHRMVREMQGVGVDHLLGPRTGCQEGRLARTRQAGKCGAEAVA